MAAIGEIGERGAVLAGQEAEILADRLALEQRAGEVGGGVLDADDIGDLGQPRHRLDAHVDHRAAGDVVNEDRDVGSRRHRREMGIKPGLSGLVVIRRDHQRRVGAHPLGVLGKARRLLGRVRSGAGDHRHPPADGLDANLGHPAVLGVAEGGRFAGGSARHHAMHPLADLPIDEFLERLLRHLAVLERRDERGDRSLEHGRPPGAATAAATSDLAKAGRTIRLAHGYGKLAIKPN